MTDAVADTWTPSLHSLESIDFVSDLHLCAAMPRTAEALLQHLEHSTADAVVILGDLFEVWVGDDMRHQPWEQAFLARLARLTARRPTAFMHGNRDFLVGADLLRETGLIGLPDPCRVICSGASLLLSHGDALCLDDAPYQAFRRKVRSPEWQRAFLARPLVERHDVAQAIRSESRTRQEASGAVHADVDPGMARQWLQSAGCPILIHGHTHRPGQHDLGAGQQRIVLSDWDLDHAQPGRAEVLRWDGNGPHRLPMAASHR